MNMGRRASFGLTAVVCVAVLVVIFVPRAPGDAVAAAPDQIKSIPVSESRPAEVPASRAASRIRTIPFAPPPAESRSTLGLLTVVDAADSRPIAGARIFAVGVRARHVDPTTAPQIALTDAEGEAVIPTLEPGSADVGVAVVHDDYVAVRVERAAPERTVVALERAYELTVQCVTAGGEPVGRVVVDVAPSSQQAWVTAPPTSPEAAVPLDWHRPCMATVATDVSGQARIRHVPAGRYHVGVRHPTMIVHPDDFVREITVDASTAVTVRLIPTYVVAIAGHTYEQMSLSGVEGWICQQQPVMNQIMRVVSGVMLRWPDVMPWVFVANSFDDRLVPKEIDVAAVSATEGPVKLRATVQRTDTFDGSVARVIEPGAQGVLVDLTVNVRDAAGTAVDGLVVEVTALGRGSIPVQVVSGRSRRVRPGRYSVGVVAEGCRLEFKAQAVTVAPGTPMVVQLVARGRMTKLTIDLGAGAVREESPLWVRVFEDGRRVGQWHEKLPLSVWVPADKAIKATAQASEEDDIWKGEAPASSAPVTAVMLTRR